jgi:hypothetical protein
MVVTKGMVEIALSDENLNKKQGMMAGRYFVDEDKGVEKLVAECAGERDQKGVNRRVGLFFDRYFRENRETKFANWE